MNGPRYLLKNVGLLSLSQFGTKILTIILVPLYTSILSTSDYGLYDLYSSSIYLLIPLLTLDISTSVLRFALETDVDKSDVFSISMKYFFISSLFVCLIVGINKILNFVPIMNEYPVIFIIMFIVININTIICNFVRGLEKIKEIAISGIICTLIIAILNILFLVNFKMGLPGYFYANILGPLIQVFYLFFASKVWKYIKFSINNKQIKKEMRAYSLPLIANDISWWVTNVSDRYIVTYFCGIVINGIYSVAYKIPNILNVFQTIFTQAWTLSAVKDFDSEYRDSFFQKCINYIIYP